MKHKTATNEDQIAAMGRGLILLGLNCCTNCGEWKNEERQMLLLARHRVLTPPVRCLCRECFVRALCDDTGQEIDGFLAGANAITLAYFWWRHSDDMPPGSMGDGFTYGMAYKMAFGETRAEWPQRLRVAVRLAGERAPNVISEKSLDDAIYEDTKRNSKKGGAA